MMPRVTAVFSSGIALVLKRYVDLKRALGRRFDEPTRTLQSVDRFLLHFKPGVRPRSILPPVFDGAK